MTALPGETPGTVGTDTPQDTVSPPDTGAEGSAHADAPEAPGASEPPGDAAGAGEPAAEVSGTDVAAAEDRPAEVPDAEAGPADADTDTDAEDGSADDDAPAEESAGDLEADAVTADGTAEAPAVPELSEAQAELAAQRELRERIEKRKAEKTAPIAAGTGLSGTAAELLAAVRAVESGEKSGTAFFDSPAPAPAARRPEPAATAAQPPRASVPAVSPAPQAASPEALDAVRAVLVAGGAPEALARPAVGVLGEQAAELLRTDPWQLLTVPGVRPEQADGFARALLGDGCGPDDGRRTAALVGWLLERAALQGHTALDAGAVRAALAERAVGDPDAAVRNAVEEGVALVFREGDDLEPDDAEAADGEGDEEGATDGAGLAEDADREPAQVLLGLDRYALAEESLADGLARLVNACEKAADWAEAAASAPSPSAAELIRTTAAAGVPSRRTRRDAASRSSPRSP
ncbi:helix-hairpin-helix domain-containing protein, partial [Streptomyces baarnensis]|uniref:helix-hairpin-helix domain-containing protein n=1 Tax=Streptomyces baarnensis TaxID=66872 RepID=UPI003081B7F0